MSYESSPCILCVEDDEDISGYIRVMLKIAGYQTVIAQNLIEGLRRAKTSISISICWITICRTGRALNFAN